MCCGRLKNSVRLEDCGTRKSDGTLTGGELDAEPHAHRHDPVVDDVQGGHLIVFLAHHEEELQRGEKKPNRFGCR